MGRYSSRGFSVMTSCLWNDLPLNVHVTDSLDVFTSLPKTLFINSSLRIFIEFWNIINGHLITVMCAFYLCKIMIVL